MGDGLWVLSMGSRDYHPPRPTSIVTKIIERKIDKLPATDFQKRVWKALLKIPRGEVRTYEWIAREIGHPKAIRAVGNAVGKNPLAPEVPCHRVIRKDGSLGGYSGPGGVRRKKRLLRWERRGTLPPFFYQNKLSL